MGQPLTGRADAPYTFRPATPADAEAIAPLLYAALADLAHLLTGTADMADALAGLARLCAAGENRLSYQQCVVAACDGMVLGVVALYAGRDAERLDAPLVARVRALRHDPTFTFDKEAEPDDYYIDTLSVAPAFAGRGIGGELIGEAERRARAGGYRRIALNVEPGNERAYRLYTRLGYGFERERVIGWGRYHYLVKRIEEDR